MQDASSTDVNKTRGETVPASIRTCGCCGLTHSVPPMNAAQRALCTRCRTVLVALSGSADGNQRTAAIALSALILFPLAVSLPMLRVERFGHANEASVLEGTIALLSSGHTAVGLVVLLCSVVFPLGKLIALLVMSAGAMQLRHEHRALTYHFVEWTGRWGMLDILLVAILVAALKIGDMVDVSAGPAALAFTAVVVLSLLATASFDPRSLWEHRPNQVTNQDSAPECEECANGE